MDDKKILIVYKSVTGFTYEYARMIAEETDCTLMDLKEVTAEIMSGYDTVVFGGRMHGWERVITRQGTYAGVIDGLQKARRLYEKSGASRFLVYAVGIVPEDEEDIIGEMWVNNLSVDLADIPHFYMVGGLRYEKMPLTDKLLLAALRVRLAKTAGKTEAVKRMQETLRGSCDMSDRRYIAPLVEALRNDEIKMMQK